MVSPYSRTYRAKLTWSIVARVSSRLLTLRLAFLRPSKAWGDDTSWMRWRSVKQLVYRQPTPLAQIPMYKIIVPSLFSWTTWSSKTLSYSVRGFWITEGMMAVYGDYNFQIEGVKKYMMRWQNFSTMTRWSLDNIVLRGRPGRYPFWSSSSLSNGGHCECQRWQLAGLCVQFSLADISTFADTRHEFRPNCEKCDRMTIKIGNDRFSCFRRFKTCCSS